MARSSYTEDNINKMQLTLPVLLQENWLMKNKIFQEAIQSNNVANNHMKFCHSGDRVLNYFVLKSAAKIHGFKSEK